MTLTFEEEQELKDKFDYMLGYVKKQYKVLFGAGEYVYNYRYEFDEQATYYIDVTSDRTIPKELTLFVGVGPTYLEASVNAVSNAYTTIRHYTESHRTVNDTGVFLFSQLLEKELKLFVNKPGTIEFKYEDMPKVYENYYIEASITLTEFDDITTAIHGKGAGPTIEDAKLNALYAIWETLFNRRRDVKH